MNSVSLILLAAYVLWLAWRSLGRFLKDPLASAKKAHWSAPYTGLWIWWQHIHDRSAEVVHQMHLRHGPVIRLGPSELSVCCVDGGIDVIYGFREAMPKTDWYQVANSHGKEPMVAIRNEAPHRVRRRMLAYPYSKTALRTNQQWSDMQVQLAGRLGSALERMSANASRLDFYDLAFAWSVDSTGGYVFGPEADLRLLDNLLESRRLREGYERQRMYQFLPLPAKLVTIIGLQGRDRLDFQDDTSRALC